jgi:hypothetical protein
MIHARLQRSELESAPVGSKAGAHLDEDALSAFVEGRLGEKESAPLIKHLVACGFCRQITAQLIRLDSELGALEEIVTTATAESEPGRLRRFLAELSARVISSSEDDVVFAYHAPAEDFQRPATDADGHKEGIVADKGEADTILDQKPDGPAR